LQITINDEKIDYELERERDLFDVLGSLRNWLQSEGFILTGARIDDRDLDLRDENRLRNTPVADVATLHIDAQTAAESAYYDLVAVREFFRVLKNTIVAKNVDAVKKVMETYPDLKGGLDSLLEEQGIASPSLNAASLHERIVACRLLDTGSASGEPRDRLFGFIEELGTAIESRMNEIENPRAELASAAAELRESVGQLGDVSVMLQTGRDQEAMQAIVRFTDLSSRIIRLYPSLKSPGGIDFTTLVVDGTTLPEFYTEFNGILGELIDAFGTEDSVLIGDLLEYEITPRLEKLRSYIDLMTGV
jgi:hypothetical protein